MHVQRRLLQVLIIFSIIFAILFIRLGYIQLYATHNFSKNSIDLVEESIKQRSQKFVLHSGRGYFVDRSGEPLNVDYSPRLIIFPFIKNFDWPVAKFADVITVNKNDLLNALEQAKGPFIFENEGKPIVLTNEQLKKINGLQIPGVYGAYVQNRSENIAPHLIGVTGENMFEVQRMYEDELEAGTISLHSEIGVSGLQRAFDPFLISRGEAALTYFVDTLQKPLFGYEVKYKANANPYHPTEVVTTIDRKLQQIVTKKLKESGIKNGGALIIDVQTSDLLAMVSVPSFRVEDPFGFGAKNHLLTAYTPGSVFKIVVATAAIEEGLVDYFNHFDCNKNLYGDGSEPRQLGRLSFEESFAASCNYTFTTLANELLTKDSAALIKYANKLGLVEKVGWKGDLYRLPSLSHFPEEELNFIIKDKEDIGDLYAISQTAIGQKNVQLTPLSVANMLATIARGGEKKQVRAATKINYENGTTVASFLEHKINDDLQISRYTAMKLQSLLRAVTKLECGTGYDALGNSKYSIAGKSGTAQKGANNNRYNYWFAGYFPANEPKYTMVIIDLDHQRSNNKVLQAYRRIVDEIYYYHQMH